MDLVDDITYEGQTILRKNQIRRRLNHLSGVLVPSLYILDVFSWVIVGQILSVAVLLAGILEAIRLETDLPERVSILHIFYRQLRSYESESIAGYFYYVLGGLLVWLIFPADIAVVSFILVSVGDPVSGVLKTTFEQLEYDVSFVIPLNIVFSFVIGATAFAVHTTASIQLIVLLGVGGAISFTIADGYPFQILGVHLDDNLLIPVFTSSAFVFVLYIFNEGSLYLPL